MSFNDHFSAVSLDYASARPTYPAALFDWIESIAPSRADAWEAGCGSGQATRDLGTRFAHVHATDPSAAQIAQAPSLDNVDFVVASGERCGLPDTSVDAVCVAQAVHWFDRTAFFAECMRVLRPRGVLVAWGYQDIVVPPALAAANAALQRQIAPYWSSERTLGDEAYAHFAWPFDAIVVPPFTMTADWPLARLLGYVSSYSASARCRQATGDDPVAMHGVELVEAWGDADATQRLQWPLFVHARRKTGR